MLGEYLPDKGTRTVLVLLFLHGILDSETLPATLAADTFIVPYSDALR